MCTAFRLLGGGSDTACPREGTPSHVSQFGDVYRVGSEGDAGQMAFCPNKSELGLAWSSGRCGSRPGRGLESRTARPWDTFDFIFLLPLRSEANVAGGVLWKHLPPSPPWLSVLLGPLLCGVLWGPPCSLPASCQLWLLGRATHLTLSQMMAQHGPLGGRVLTGG